MEEKLLYQNGVITVTQSRYIVGDKTFAMRNISSVQLGVISPNWSPGILLTGLGVCLLFIEQDY